MKLQDALSRIREVAETLPEDDPDREEMLNVEGDYSALMEWALRKRNEYAAMAEASKELAATYADRKKAFENRAEKMKDVAFIIMTTAGEKKYQGAAATASIRNVPPKPIIQDEALIPDDYWKEVRSIDKTLINQAVKDGYQVPGVVLDNGGLSLSVRTK